jgi:NADPH:quinone reductase-like Zn-dependent oxidoreductase
MKAVVQDGYCGPEELRLEEVPKPEIAEDEVLMKVKAASVNPFDWHVIAAGIHTLRDCRRALTPEGTFVSVGSSKIGNVFSILLSFVKPGVMSRFTSQKFVSFLTNGTKENLLFLANLVEEGKLRPVVDRTYPLAEAPAAIAYQEQGHARGKVVLVV